MMLCICNPSTEELETERPEIQGQPWLYSEFETSLGYMRPLSLNKSMKTEVTSANHIYMYVCIHMHIYVCTYMYAYIHTLREDLSSQGKYITKTLRI